MMLIHATGNFSTSSRPRPIVTSVSSITSVGEKAITSTRAIRPGTERRVIKRFWRGSSLGDASLRANRPEPAHGSSPHAASRPRERRDRPRGGPVAAVRPPEAPRVVPGASSRAARRRRRARGRGRGRGRGPRSVGVGDRVDPSRPRPSGPGCEARADPRGRAPPAGGRAPATPGGPDGRIEPLVAVYRREALLVGAREALRALTYANQDVVRRLHDVRYVSTDTLRSVDRDLLSFANVNTRRDLSRALRL